MMIATGTAYGQPPSGNDCPPPNYCYTRKMDSMAIRAKTFQDQFEVIVKTYQKDSAAFVGQIKSDSTFKAVQADRLEDAYKANKRLKIKNKIIAASYGIGGGFIGWLLRKFVFG